MGDGNAMAMFGTAQGIYAVDVKLSEEHQWEIRATWEARVRGGRLAEWGVYCDDELVLCPADTLKKPKGSSGVKTPAFGTHYVGAKAPTP